MPCGTMGKAQGGLGSVSAWELWELEPCGWGQWEEQGVGALWMGSLEKQGPSLPILVWHQESSSAQHVGIDLT